MKRNMCSKRRHGVVLVYVALSLVVLIGAAGLSVDVGNLYLQRDKAQRAADAAALAGALKLMVGQDRATADDRAKDIAADNGYDTDEGATFASAIDPDHSNWYQVTVAKPVPLYFMGVFGFSNTLVGAPATAVYEISETPVQLDINGNKRNYGIETGSDVNISLFGPYGEHYNGDRYSTMYLTNGKPNPDYDGKGYDFTVSIPKNYQETNGTSLVDLQIQDPDTYNAGDVSSPSPGSRMDEMWSMSNDSNVPSRPWLSGDDVENYNDSKYTKTRYTLYDTKGTSDTKDDTIIATATYGKDTSTDMKWVTPDGFSFDITKGDWASRFTNPNGGDSVDFRLNAKTINGTSENGFSLRAGPPIVDYTKTTTDGHYEWQQNRWGSWKQVWVPGKTQYCTNGDTCYDTLPADGKFNSANGTNITASGRIPMNFDTTGYVKIHMGIVPAGANTITIDKFDTDVNAKSVTYYDGNTYPNENNGIAGILSSNDTWKKDIINLPSNYPGGDWYAAYYAGLQDTSVWDMSYTGTSGYVRLVK